MAKISNTISPAPAITQKIVFVIYKTTDPAEVARIVKNPPHPVPYNFQFNNIDPGVYIVKIHQSVDGIALGNLLHDYWVDSTTNNVILERRHYHVDGPDIGDPASGQNILADPYLDGKNITGVFQEGFRFLEPPVNPDGSPNPEKEFDLHTGGGIELVFPNTFQFPQVFSIDISYAGIPQGNQDSAFNSIEILTGNTTLISAQYNKTLLVRASGTAVVITAPNVASVADGKGYVIHHDGGSAINVEFRMQAGEVVRFRGADVNHIYLGKGEWIRVFKRTITGEGSKFYCTEYEGQWARIGETIPFDTWTKDNALVKDGMEYDGLIYKRAFEYVQNLPVSQRVSYATFDLTVLLNGENIFYKRGFFALDAVNSKFKVPDLLNKSIRFIKNNGGADASRMDNVPGGYQHWSVGEHLHTGLSAENTSHSSGSSVQPGANVKLLVNTSGGAVTTIANSSTNYHNPGGENNVRNVGEVPMLLI